MASRPAASKLPGILFILAMLTAVPVLWLVVLPMIDGRNWPRHASHLPLVLTHLVGGLVMLAFGAAALQIGWTRRRFHYHKLAGYGYLGCGTVGALAALALAGLVPHKPASTAVATATLALVWLAFAAMALRAARNRRFDTHREWVIRSYVVTWTFVGCRLATLIDAFPWLGMESITAAIWVNWTVPVIVCEIALQWDRGRRLQS